MTRRLALGLAGSALAALLAACGTATAGSGSASATSQASARSQRNEGGQVTMVATWLGPDAGPVFTVAMDTHAVDLDGYDLRQLALLRTDEGRQVQPATWDAPKGGHHRSGTLTFPKTAADGTAVLDASTTWLELDVRDVAGVPSRTFRWTV